MFNQSVGPGGGNGISPGSAGKNALPLVAPSVAPPAGETENVLRMNATGQSMTVQPYYQKNKLGQRQTR